MDGIARFMLRHRWWVIAFWLAALIGGGLTAAKTVDALSYNFSLPGQEGSETEAALAESYGVASELGFLPVFTPVDGEPVAEHREDVAAVAEQIRATGAQVIDYAGTGDRSFVTDDGSSTFMFVYSPAGPPDSAIQAIIEDALADSAVEHGFSVGVTGVEQLSEGDSSSAGAEEDSSVLTETLLGAGGALIVLLFVFASFLALLPLLIAAVSILSTFLVVLGLTAVTEVSFIVEFLIALIGMGVAIDYSLLVVTRWREERGRGVSNDEAIVTSVRTAGHAVLASGVTVAISLVALVVVNVPAVRSIGFGGMLIPLVSTLVVLSLLPALLSLVGPRVDWPRVRSEHQVSRAWTAWTRGVLRHRPLAIGVALAGLALAIVPFFGLQIGRPGADSLADRGEAHDTLMRLERGGVGDGVLTPMILLVETASEESSFASGVDGVEGVRSATVLPAAPDGVTEILVVPEHETVDNTSIRTVTAVRDAVGDRDGYIGVTGIGAGVIDWQNAVYKIFPYVLGLIAFVTFVLLVRSFRSIVLPLKGVVLNLVSVAAVFGLTTWFWQEGHGSEALFGIDATGAMTFWLPVVVFAFLFGLSMDYEVFILARMREEYDRTGSTDQAVEQGLGRTGRLVTSAALILFFAFAALASSPGTDIKVLATALGVGILLDATVIRALLVPALVSWFGPYNWWLPGWVAWVLRVEPSPLKPDAGPSSGPSVEPEAEPEPVVGR